MTNTRRFATLDVVTVTTGILVSDRGMKSVYDLCGFLLDAQLFTDQLSGASRVVTPLLEEQHPWLTDLKPPKGDKPALKAWCAALVQEHGTEIDVSPFTDTMACDHCGVGLHRDDTGWFVGPDEDSYCPEFDAGHGVDGRSR